MRISFVVYGEPTAKGRPRFYRRGKFVGTYTPKKTENAEQSFALQSLKYKPETPLEGQLHLAIDIFKKIPKSMSKKECDEANVGLIRPITRPDWDNYAKLVCDAMNGIFWRDDSQIVSCIVRKFYSLEPRIGILLYSK